MAGRRETKALKPIDDTIGRMGASDRAVKQFIPDYTLQFTHLPADPASAFVPLGDAKHSA
jgi:hypothetical protein